MHRGYGARSLGSWIDHEQKSKLSTGQGACTNFHEAKALTETSLSLLVNSPIHVLCVVTLGDKPRLMCCVTRAGVGPRLTQFFFCAGDCFILLAFITMFVSSGYFTLAHNAVEMRLRLFCSLFVFLSHVVWCYHGMFVLHNMLRVWRGCLILDSLHGG